MSDTLIKVENVSKKFCRSLKRSLWYGIQDLGSELIGRRHGGDGNLRREEFWAVKDISFELKRGECLGLIGRNGAGKTTLLRMLNGLIKPDAGRIEMRGRIGALIALGAGFNPVLTGRENILINASVHGMSARELNSKIDEIIEFSELSEFMQTPVQQYSSGMQARLGFAIAVSTRPDILLVDEALAVGDIAFVTKCLNRIAALRGAGTGVVFVSHNELQIRSAATHAIVLDRGQLLLNGSLTSAFHAYNARTGAHPILQGPEAGYVHTGPISIAACRIEGPSNQATLETGQSMIIKLSVASSERIRDANLELRIWNASGQIVTSVHSDAERTTVNLDCGKNQISVNIENLPLVPGIYRMAGGFRKDGEVLGWTRDLAYFDVTPPKDRPISEGIFCIRATILCAESDSRGMPE